MDVIMVSNKCIASLEIMALKGRMGKKKKKAVVDPKGGPKKDNKKGGKAPIVEEKKKVIVIDRPKMYLNLLI